MRSGLRVALPPTLPLTWSRREQNAKSAGASGVRTWVEGTGRGRGRVSGRANPNRKPNPNPKPNSKP